MNEFIEALTHYDFLQYAFCVGLLASLACGIVGSLVVVRRLTYLAGAIAHSVLGGMGVARYLHVSQGWGEWCSPLLGALISGCLAALLVGLVSLQASQREDTTIGAIWGLGMALGIIFISRTPGYDVDLMGYLFGNILMVGLSDLWVLAILDLVLVLVMIGFYRQFLAICFDEEFSRLRGLNVDFYFLLLLGITALTVVLLSTIVGLVMVIALLTLPAAIASHFSCSLQKIMIIAILISSLFTSLGLSFSYGPDLPAGATIVVLSGSIYLLVVFSTWFANHRILRN